MNNFWQRALTGTLFVIVLSTAIYFSAYSYALLFLAVVVLGMQELRNVAKEHFNKLSFAFSMSIGLLLYVLFFAVAAEQLPAKFLLAIPASIALAQVAMLYNKVAQPFTKLAWCFLLPMYVALPFACMHFLVFKHGVYQYKPLLGFFILLWSSDTFAYLFGRAFGKHKLFERHSPKKTWEGSLGGAVLSLIISYFLYLGFNIYSPALWAAMAMVVVVGGTWGDLTESMLKRNFSIKDSGNILPGHGGILDRFDGLLISMPLLVLLLQFFA